MFHRFSMFNHRFRDDFPFLHLCFNQISSRKQRDDVETPGSPVDWRRFSEAVDVGQWSVGVYPTSLLVLRNSGWWLPSRSFVSPKKMLAMNMDFYDGRFFMGI